MALEKSIYSQNMALSSTIRVQGSNKNKKTSIAEFLYQIKGIQIEIPKTVLEKTIGRADIET